MGEVTLMSKKKPRDLEELADELEVVLGTMARSLVDHPADLVIQRATNPSGFVSFEVTYREEEFGSLVGKRGAHAEAMRALLMAGAAARRVRVSVMFMSSQGGTVRR